MLKISEKLYIALSFLVISITVIVYIVFGVPKNEKISGWSQEDHRVAAEWYINLVKEYNYDDEYTYIIPRVLPSKEEYEVIKEGITNIEAILEDSFPRSLEELVYEWISIEGRTLALMSSGCGPALGEWVDLIIPDPDNEDGFREAGVDMKALEKSLETDALYFEFIKSGGIDPVVEHNRIIMKNLLNECRDYNKPVLLTEQQGLGEDNEVAECLEFEPSFYESNEFIVFRGMALDDSSTFGPIIEIPIEGWMQNGGSDILIKYCKV